MLITATRNEWDLLHGQLISIFTNHVFRLELYFRIFCFILRSVAEKYYFCHLCAVVEQKKYTRARIFSTNLLPPF